MLTIYVKKIVITNARMRRTNFNLSCQLLQNYNDGILNSQQYKVSGMSEMSGAHFKLPDQLSGFNSRNNDSMKICFSTAAHTRIRLNKKAAH